MSFQFVKFILDNWTFKVTTMGSQLHGVRRPRFYCVQMVKTKELGSLKAILSAS